MPELPEVETVCRGLEASGIMGQTITSVQVLWERTLHGIKKDQFIKKLTGAVMHQVRRRAKYIVIDLKTRGVLCVHLKMTGKMVVFKQGQSARAPHDRLIISFSNGQSLHFNDTRKFGKWQLVDSEIPVLAKLGPEPLTTHFDLQSFTKSIQNSRRKIKTLLLDQMVIAGVGNIYADEAMYDAGISPLRCGQDVSKREVRGLLSSIRKVLKQGIRNQGTSLGDGKTNYLSVNRRPGQNFSYLKVFRRTGEPCARCHTPIMRVVIGQRSTHFCPECQT